MSFKFGFAFDDSEEAGAQLQVVPLPPLYRYHGDGSVITTFTHNAADIGAYFATRKLIFLVIADAMSILTIDGVDVEPTELFRTGTSWHDVRAFIIDTGEGSVWENVTTATIQIRARGNSWIYLYNCPEAVAIADLAAGSASGAGISGNVLVLDGDGICALLAIQGNATGIAWTGLLKDSDGTNQGQTNPANSRASQVMAGALTDRTVSVSIAPNNTKKLGVVAVTKRTPPDLELTDINTVQENGSVLSGTVSIGSPSGRTLIVVALGSDRNNHLFTTLTLDGVVATLVNRKTFVQSNGTSYVGDAIFMLDPALLPDPTATSVSFVATIAGAASNRRWSYAVMRMVGGRGQLFHSGEGATYNSRAFLNWKPASVGLWISQYLISGNNNFYLPGNNNVPRSWQATTWMGGLVWRDQRLIDSWGFGSNSFAGTIAANFI